MSIDTMSIDTTISGQNRSIFFLKIFLYIYNSCFIVKNKFFNENV